MSDASRSGRSRPEPALTKIAIGVRHMARIKPLMEVLDGVTRFGRLTVVGEAPRIVSPSGFSAVAAYVRCDCGVEKVVRGRGLVTGYTNSCGCLQRELTAVKIAERSRTHGRTGTVEHHTWTTMKQRCHNPTDKQFHRYGGRGITVCERWRDNFEAFLEDMGLRPANKTSIDRIDNSKGYEPGNCRWADDIEQHNNKRNNRILTIDTESATVAEWARRSGTDMYRIHGRLAQGWSAQEAVFGPAGGGRFITQHPRTKMVMHRGEEISLKDLGARYDISPKYIADHMRRGKTCEEAVALLAANKNRYKRKPKPA